MIKGQNKLCFTGVAMITFDSIIPSVTISDPFLLHSL